MLKSLVCVISIVFITLWYILLLSLCFRSACLPATLLLLSYILWYFIIYFKVISVDLTCAFVLVFRISCISFASFLVMIFLIIISHPDRLTHIVWDLLGRISGSNIFVLIFQVLSFFHLYFPSLFRHTLFYI